jgi:hypothetical protein
MIFGAAEQFTLIPTTSLGEKKLAHASRSLFVLVSACIPVDNILRMTASSTRSVSGRWHLPSAGGSPRHGIDPAFPAWTPVPSC